MQDCRSPFRHTLPVPPVPQNLVFVEPMSITGFSPRLPSAAKPLSTSSNSLNTSGSAMDISDAQATLGLQRGASQREIRPSTLIFSFLCVGSIVDPGHVIREMQTWFSLGSCRLLKSSLREGMRQNELPSCTCVYILIFLPSESLKRTAGQPFIESERERGREARCTCLFDVPFSSDIALSTVVM